MIGLDVSDRSIKIVELTEEEVPKLRTACWSPVQPNLIRRGTVTDVTGVAAVIEETMRKCSAGSVSGELAVVSIPEVKSFVRLVELPLMSRAEVNEAVQWAIRQHVPFDLDRIYIDWQAVPNVINRPDRQAVLVGAAQKDVVDPLLEAVDSVGLRAVAFELESQALVRGLLPRDSGDVVGVLLIDLGATSTNVIFYDRGAIRFTSSIQHGGDDLTRDLVQALHLQPSIADEKKALVGAAGASSDPQVAAALRSSSATLVQEIRQVVDQVMSHQTGTEGIKAILLAGGAANLSGIVNVFAEVFPGIPVQLGNPLINLQPIEGSNQPPLSPTDATHFTTAIGLALRRAEET